MLGPTPCFALIEHTSRLVPPSHHSLSQLLHQADPDPRVGKTPLSRLSLEVSPMSSQWVGEMLISIIPLKLKRCTVLSW